ncbi:hypothetical protein [Gilvimarinus agarilyticus]|uniref:hypothetical protein n=1 Tax=Gilvimarinus agarilyticus TaxID=679259 RepID=UPI0012FAE71E|nr:hypothetical protein [Gilvimarinus agarilyticus]
MWAVRQLYLCVMLLAVYRSYAELSNRFDLPYGLLAVVFVPVLLVMVMLECHWFI